MAGRKRSVGSVKAQLVAKAREAALSAIRTYNDPQTTFKSETFIVLTRVRHFGVDLRL